MDLKQAMKSILVSEQSRREDQLAERYLLASTLETHVHKEREAIKAQILGYEFGKLSVPRLIERSVDLVAQTGIMSSVVLIRGHAFDVGAQIKTSGSTVDFEVLRKTLGISEKRWETAVKLSSYAKNPSVTLNVMRK